MGLLKKLRPCTTCQECSSTPCTGPAPVVTSSGSVTHAHGTSFSYTITATNSPTSFSATSLPAGLSLNTSTGVISGTLSCPSRVFTVHATNACGTGSKEVTVTVTGGGSIINNATTASGKIGVAFSFYLTATNSPIGFDASPLPDGLSINTSTGQISGTPTTAGVTVAATSAYNICGGSSNTLTFTISDTCDLPTTQCDTVASDAAKQGYSENPGHLSTPPKIYRRRTMSGAMTFRSYNAAECFSGTPATQVDYTWSGYCEYNDDGTIIYSGILVDGASAGCGDPNAPGCASGDCAPVTTGASITYSADNTESGSFPCVSWDGDVTDVLSNEFTTAQLIAKAVAELPSYPGTWSGDCEAIRDLDTDEVTYSVQRFKYRFQLPSLTGRSAYKISWKEAGVSKSYTWDGTATVTPEYGPVSEPGSNGSVGITDLAVDYCY